jgi:cell shape-determining protein MreD
MTFFNSVLVGLAAFAISMFVFYLAILFGGKTANFIAFNHYGWIAGVLGFFVFALCNYLRARRVSKARTASNFS